MNVAIWRTQRLGIVIIIAVAVLYPTVWPHEVGHSVAPYLYGCKKTFWQTDTSWFLLSSWGGKDIDDNCLQRRGHAAAAWTAFGGVAVNLLLLFVLLPVLWRSHQKVASSWWFVTLFFWALANYAEAFSYLVLNTAWLKSDMETLVTESGINRWIIFLVGLVLAVAMARVFRPIAQKAAAMLATPNSSERLWRFGFVLYVALVGAVMTAARVALT
jgi:hypothetical protein